MVLTVFCRVMEANTSTQSESVEFLPVNEGIDSAAGAKKSIHTVLEWDYL